MPSTEEGNGGGASSTAPRLSRHSRFFLKEKMQKDAKKEVDKRKRNLHYAAASRHQRSLHCLTKFDCPVCCMKNTVRVDLSTKEQNAVVRCTYCVSLRPRPAELPYPFLTSFVPRLENRADVFFKFNELYRGLAVEADPSGKMHKVHDDTGVGENYTAGGVLSISSSHWTSGVTGMPIDADGKAASGGEEDEEGEERKEEEEEEEEEELVGAKDASGTVEDMHAFFADSDGDDD
ncbi:Transcription elongation factor 1 domain-containing protein [Trypanosoma cruzi]|nr:Transcription elongation factor 1 domain-containing protein [Trypanosoma cruzi]